MEFSYIKELVGNITKRDLLHIESFVIPGFGIFLPVTGRCGYSVKKNHTHPAYSFILSPNSIVLSGSEIAKSKEHDSLIAMSPDFKHHEDIIEDYTRYFAIFIKKDFFESVLKLYCSDIPFYENSVFKVTTDLVPILKSFIVEYRDKLPGYRDQLNILSQRIVHLIIRNCLNVESSAKNISQRFEIESAIEYIHSNFMNKISVEDISRSVNYSVSTFSRLFKSEVGTTLSSYIIKTRVSKAKKMLEQGRLSIIDIAYSCGFNSPSHLSSTFKKSLGSTPSEYQKLIGRKAEF